MDGHMDGRMDWKTVVENCVGDIHFFAMLAHGWERTDSFTIPGEGAVEHVDDPPAAPLPPAPLPPAPPSDFLADMENEVREQRREDRQKQRRAPMKHKQANDVYSPSRVCLNEFLALFKDQGVVPLLPGRLPRGSFPSRLPHQP